MRSLNIPTTNLPGELTSFVGRRRELAQVGELLGGVRLLTLTGAGGCGKTRLALQVAAGALDGHPDGVWWVEVARLEDAALLPAAVIGAIGLREMPGSEPVETLVGYLHTRHTLLILDNCEHLVTACAQLADMLVRSCPSVTVLATSRAPLGVLGEHGVASSVDVAAGQNAKRADHGAAPVRRRVPVPRAPRRCAPISPSPRPTRPSSRRSVTTSTASRWPSSWPPRGYGCSTPEQIAHRLGDRFHLLTGGACTAVRRHQTLQASLDWSHDLLSDGERALLRRLSVFAGGATLNAAEQVCPGDGIARDDLLDLVTGLVDKSLVSTDARGPEMRYGLLETVRQYAAARLADAGEVDVLRERHLAYHLALVEASEPQVLGAGRDDPVLTTAAIELPNLRAALDRATVTDPNEVCVWWPR